MSLLGDLAGSVLGAALGNQQGQLQGGLAGLAGGAGGALTPLLLQLLANGGLQKILAAFQQNGMGAQAASWVSTGENLPIDGAQVKAALGPQVDQIAQQTGMSGDEAADGLAQILPGAINQLTPGGQVGPELQGADIGALGKLLGIG